MARPEALWLAGALGRYLRLHGEDTDDLVLKAMVPVSVRADVERRSPITRSVDALAYWFRAQL